MPLPLKYPLFLRLHSSRWAATALLMIHCFAFTAIVASQVTWTVKAFLLLLLLLSLGHGLRRHAWRSASSAVVALNLAENGDIELTRGDGRYIRTRLDSSSTVLHWLVALQLRHEGRWMSLFLLPDMMDADSWRRLSVLLRVGKSTC